MQAEGMDIPQGPIRTEPIRRVLPSRHKEREERSREDFRELVDEEAEREEEERPEEKEDSGRAPEKKKDAGKSQPHPSGQGDNLDLIV